MSDWIDETLIDPETHLVFDGIKAGSLVRAQYTYCQGVVLGLDTELAVRTEDAEHAERVHRLVAAVAEHMAPDGVIKGAGGGDGGLFNGILARYLALVATDASAARTRRREGARHRAFDRARVGADRLGQPADRRRTCRCSVPFWDRDGRDCRRPAAKDAQFVEGAVNSSEIPERDLSVQLSGWMLMEAAHTVAGDDTDVVAQDESETPISDRTDGPEGVPSASVAAQSRQQGHQDHRQHRSGAAARRSPSSRSSGPIRHGRRAIRTLLDTHVGFSFGDTTSRLTVKHLVNDGLMTFFFFIVGLEVTRRVHHRRAHRPVPGRGARGRRGRRAGDTRGDLPAVQPVGRGCPAPGVW